MTLYCAVHSRVRHEPACDRRLADPFTDVAPELHTTPLPAVDWSAPPPAERNQRGRIDYATPKTRVLRQMRED